MRGSWDERWVEGFLHDVGNGMEGDWVLNRPRSSLLDAVSVLEKCYPLVGRGPQRRDWGGGVPGLILLQPHQQLLQLREDGLQGRPERVRLHGLQRGPPGGNPGLRG